MTQSLINKIYSAALGGKKKKLAKLGPVVEKKEIPVETDANKLVNYVCGSNILKTGQDIKVGRIQKLRIHMYILMTIHITYHFLTAQT